MATTRDFAAEPVRYLPEEETEEPTSGEALCLSGGGYRAMLFHLGVLWRLDHAGRLSRLDRISSVSGGSITAGALAMAWSELEFDTSGRSSRFEERVVTPVRTLAGQGIDVSSVVLGGLWPFASIGEQVAAAYRRYLFGDTSLAALPDQPRFVFNATNVGSGALFRFSKPYLADWRVGRVLNPDVELAAAVAASSAFPPFLSPYRLQVPADAWTTEAGNDLAAPEHRDELVLTDGGVYDNLGLEAAWKRCVSVLVSDAGGQMRADDDPAGNWPEHMVRVLQVIDNQVRSLRKRQVIEAFQAGRRRGTYVGIRSNVADYGLADPLPAPHERTLRLADLPTRLAEVDDQTQERLINWGYAVADAGLRRWVDPGQPAPRNLPYPSAGVG